MPRAPLPEGLVPGGNAREFTDADVPAGLLREHALGPGHWALLTMLEGAITFVDMGAQEEFSVPAGETVPIHPEVPHRVVVNGPMRCRLEFFTEAKSG